MGLGAAEAGTTSAKQDKQRSWRYSVVMGRPGGVVFDLDGTLVDSVYQHVLAWQEALSQVGIELSTWRIHRKVGMSGGLLTQALLRETGGHIDPQAQAQLLALHARAYAAHAHRVRPLPGAEALLSHLASQQVPFAIATSGRRETAQQVLAVLPLPPETPLVTRDQVRHAKPDPDLFLEAASRLHIAPEEAVVVGDSVWDLLAARRARSLGVGLLSGGYGQDELVRAGAYRVYEDPVDLLRHLDEVGIRVP